MPPKEWFGVARPNVEFAAIPVAESRDCALSLPAPTKTWPRDRLDPHEYEAAHPVRGSRNKSGKGQSAKQSASIDYTRFIQEQNSKAAPTTASAAPNLNFHLLICRVEHQLTFVARVDFDRVAVADFAA